MQVSHQILCSTDINCIRISTSKAENTVNEMNFTLWMIFSFFALKTLSSQRNLRNYWWESIIIIVHITKSKWYSTFFNILPSNWFPCFTSTIFTTIDSLLFELSLLSVFQVTFNTLSLFNTYPYFQNSLSKIILCIFNCSA